MSKRVFEMTPKQRFAQLKKKYKYDSVSAEEKIKFIETHCRHVEGDLYGEPLILPDLFKDEILRPIFGLKKKNGKRLINTVYIQMPRKNAKTTMMAAVELALLFNDGENSAQIYNCAGDDEQAGLLFSATKKMRENDPVLRDNSEAFRSSITYKDSYIKKITSKSDTKHGMNAHAVIYDEIHVATNRDLYDTLKTSMGQRSNPFFIMITTPGWDKSSICYNRYEYSLNLLKGTFEDDSFWCVIYDCDPSLDIFSPKTWEAANPLYKYSENLRETIRNEAKEAQNDTTAENTFRRLRLGQWTQSETKWIKTELWTGLIGKTSKEEYEGSYCWLGLDLSSTSDLTSLCSLFDDGEFLVPFWDLWIPEKAAETYERKFNIPFSLWEKNGHINIVDGNTISFSSVEERIHEINEECSIRKMGYDEWNSKDLATRIESNTSIETFINPQGFRLSNALKKIKEKIVSGKFIHTGNPVITWCLDNVMVKTNDELNIKIVKPQDEKKIDTWISLAMAVNEWMIDGQKKSVYSERGVISI
jgi:phage terminase large subunit-like protein